MNEKEFFVVYGVFELNRLQELQVAVAQMIGKCLLKAIKF